MNHFCCGGDEASEGPCDLQAKEQSTCCGTGAGAMEGVTPLEWFGRMIPNCLAYAKDAQQQGRPIVGIMCEFTPRELIMAAGGVPVCLCGGSNNTIPDAETQLPGNLCPLIKSTYGYHVNGGNPFLEMADLIVAETTCDGKKKMYELMAGQLLVQQTPA
ncbi:MAG: 2-hydroxyacyl-CoA dehydratase, partial [Planctomycetota bacterium]